MKYSWILVSSDISGWKDRPIWFLYSTATILPSTLERMFTLSPAEVMNGENAYLHDYLPLSSMMSWISSALIPTIASPRSSESEAMSFES